MKTAIIGWGSLLWDDRPQFDQHHGPWFYDGPRLRLEFSRISVRRQKALTLVLEEELGAVCPTAYCVSHREDVRQAMEDLSIREGAKPHEVGVWRKEATSDVPLLRPVPPVIEQWARQTDFDYVLWTWLPNNFQELSPGQVEFSLTAAAKHIRSLDAEGQAKAAEYIFRAPEFIQTPLRSELESADWFCRLWEQAKLKSS
ncbi:hypothetical protein [Blastopirellula marina]|uniref:Uncharacterized protein n=1 Tax=Blastopirellula marina TaxID=124 RepID=A0A2S8GLI6_9BACT|nr:hypothetical protein [Blastopirellula marina]PQO45295.1 hypothetical protein C5Y93_15180 [Blastopirellula marina]